MFHRISHLDLVTQWSWKAVMRGFQYLCCLTHLSITWKQSHYVTDALQDLLHHPDFAVLVLWMDEPATYPLVINSLIDEELWLHAAHIITWYKENNITTVEHPLFLKDTSAYPEINLVTFPWKHD
ncbi:hypothetical protein HD554DRAFT_2035473 [Boletus coccyginus]|nr:hypothetical protein HD554DRAFT_2035473 [Boletus coccyginus]